LTLHKDGRATTDPRRLLSSYSSTVHSGLVPRSRYSCIRRWHALPLPYSRWMCFAAHPSGRRRRACESQANAYHTNRTSNCQYNRPDRTTKSSSLDGHRFLRSTKSRFHTSRHLCKPRTTASLTRHDSRRVRHFCLQVALEDNESAQGMKACMIAISPTAIHLCPGLLQGSIFRWPQARRGLEKHGDSLDTTWEWTRKFFSCYPTRCCLLLKCSPISFTGRQACWSIVGLAMAVTISLI
jgi:hypothetical protein